MREGEGEEERGPNPEKLRPRGVGPRRVVGEEEEASSRGNSVGYGRRPKSSNNHKQQQSRNRNTSNKNSKQQAAEGGRASSRKVSRLCSIARLFRWPTHIAFP